MNYKELLLAEKAELEILRKKVILKEQRVKLLEDLFASDSEDDIDSAIKKAAQKKHLNTSEKIMNIVDPNQSLLMPNFSTKSEKGKHFRLEFLRFLNGGEKTLTEITNLFKQHGKATGSEKDQNSFVRVFISSERKKGRVESPQLGRYVITEVGRLMLNNGELDLRK